MLWTLDENGELDAVFVRTGITDGQYTAVVSPRISEGMQVVASIVTSSTKSSQSNPFQGTQQPRRRGPPPGL